MLVLSVLVAVGCNRTESVHEGVRPPAAEGPPVAAVPTNTARASLPYDLPTEIPGEATPEGIGKVGVPPANENPSGEPEDCERVVLLTPGGPVVVDIWITIDGRPHTEAVAEIIDQAIAAGDTDDDGRPTWQEWRRNVDFFAQLIPSGRPSDRQLTNWIETYDQNRDKRVQRTEMAAWLGRDSGRSAMPLAVRSRRSYGSAGSVDSRLWSLLDTDSSGSLSFEEIQSTDQELQALDADDNRILIQAELASLQEQLTAGQAGARRFPRAAGRHAALHFGDHFDSGRLGYLLSDLYAPRQSLTPGSFPGLSNLFAELDENGDGWLADEDLSRLQIIDPHVRMAIAFDDGSGGRSVIAALEIDGRADELQVAARPSEGRVVMALAGSRVAVSVHDMTASLDSSQELRRSEVQLMVHDHDDALFDLLDANADGLLGERELATATRRLSACDANGDRLVSSTELPYTMIMAFQRGADPRDRSFYVPSTRASSVGAHHAPAWFKAADFNGDGDLSYSEFLGPNDAFRELDTNGDDFIDTSEAAAADGTSAPLE